MIVVRAFGVLLAGLLAVAAVTGFAVQRTLDEPAAFTAAMTAALDDPGVNAEIKREVTIQAERALDRLADSGGTLAQLGVGLGRNAVAEQAAAVVDTDVFRSAWRGWSSLVFSGLVAKAQGRTDPAVSVSRTSLTIAIAPLLQPIFGEGIAGGAARLLDFVDADSHVTVDTGIPIGPMLQIVGTLAQWRWVLLIAAAAVGLLVLIGRRWAIWGAVLFAWTALLCAAAGGLMAAAQQQPVPGTDHPRVGLAIVAAATGRWDDLLFTAAGASAVVAGIMLVVAALTRTRRSAAPAAP